MKNCLICKNEYVAYRESQKYCRSSSCKREYLKRYYMTNRKHLILKVKEYKHRNKEKAREWSLKGKRVLGNMTKPRDCRMCGNPFMPTGNHQKYCHKCSNYRSNLRHGYIIKGLQGQHTKEEWEWVKKCFDYICLLCGKREPYIKLTRDHKIPITMQGCNSIDNIQPLCRSCNSRKSNRIWFSSCPVNQKNSTT